MEQLANKSLLLTLTIQFDSARNCYNIPPRNEMKAPRTILDYEIARPLTCAARMGAIPFALLLLVVPAITKGGIPVSAWIAAGAACFLLLGFFTTSHTLFPKQLQKRASIALFAIPALGVVAQTIFPTNFSPRPADRASQLLKESIIPLIPGANLSPAFSFISACGNWYGSPDAAPALRRGAREPASLIFSRKVNVRSACNPATRSAIAISEVPEYN